MSIVKNSPADGNVSYKGSAVDFINYFADHLKLRYQSNYEYIFIYINLTHCLKSLEFVQENASEVKKKGQVVPAVQAILNNVNLTILKFI